MKSNLLSRRGRPFTDSEFKASLLTLSKQDIDVQKRLAAMSIQLVMGSHESADFDQIVQTASEDTGISFREISDIVSVCYFFAHGVSETGDGADDEIADIIEDLASDDCIPKQELARFKDLLTHLREAHARDFSKKLKKYYAEKHALPYIDTLRADVDIRALFKSDADDLPSEDRQNYESECIGAMPFAIIHLTLAEKSDAAEKTVHFQLTESDLNRFIRELEATRKNMKSALSFMQLNPKEDSE